MEKKPAEQSPLAESSWYKDNPDSTYLHTRLIMPMLTLVELVF